MPFLTDLFSNLLANFVFWVGLGALVWLFYLQPVRKKFETFFGLKNDLELDIYLSNLWDPRITEEPWGEIIAGRELEAAEDISSMVASASPGFPEIVRGLVDNIWIREKFKITIKISPKEYSYSPKNMIVIGSTTKNSIRRWFANKNKLLAEIRGEPRKPPADIFAKPLKPEFVIKTTKGQAAYKVPEGTVPALIERLVVNAPDDDKNSCNVVFMCAGLTSFASMIATHYLAKNWRTLERLSRAKKHFVRCLILDRNGDVVNCTDYFDDQ